MIHDIIMTTMMYVASLMVTVMSSRSLRKPTSLKKKMGVSVGALRQCNTCWYHEEYWNDS